MTLSCSSASISEIFSLAALLQAFSACAALIRSACSSERAKPDKTTGAGAAVLVAVLRAVLVVLSAVLSNVVGGVDGMDVVLESASAESKNVQIMPIGY